MYRLATFLMRWSDLNVFRRYMYQFRIMGCSLKVRVFRTILVCWENVQMTNEAWGSYPHPPNRNMYTALTFGGIVQSKHIWHHWIQNDELQVILIYMFPIKTIYCSKMAHFHKNVGL